LLIGRMSAARLLPVIKATIRRRAYDRFIP